MALEDDLYTLFSTDASIAAAMGVPQPNVYRDAIPKSMPDSPALVFQTMPGGEFYAGAEAMNALQMKPVQFDSYHVYPNIALQISNAVRDLIKNMRQVSLANTQVQGVIITKDHGMPQEPGANGYVQRRLLLAEFWHTEGAGSVPFTPIQAPVAGSNAAYLEGVPVSTAPPTDGQGLVFDAASGLWKPGTVSGGGSANFADGEVPSGTINGTNGSDGNATFTLAHTPLATPVLLKNGQGMTRGTAYTLSVNSITYLAPYIPVIGDSHAIWYRF
jgi:hypothetical protein